MWYGKIWTVLLGSGLAIISTDASGASSAHNIRIDTRNQSLADALLDVARQNRIEMVIAAPASRTMTAPRLHGRYSIDEALSKLLAGTGLIYRRSGDGTYIIATPSRAPAESEAVALPEILVVGRKTQNSDIRRGENNIQPYKVWTSEDVAQSHSSDINDFLRNRVTSNAQAAAAMQIQSNDRADVDLRGLGASQTLLLVDGRRLPGGGSILVDVFQPDLNAIPLSSIDRIEVLNSTAGGIYGPGATAGVINIVLKRDYHGADFGLTYGVSARGDAASRRIDARAGFTSKDGNTQFMIAASRTWGADLRNGDRDFTIRARALQQQHDPAGFAATPPVSSSVNIVSVTGAPLQLDPIYGGANLGAATTSVPVTYGGVASDGGALYGVNAGTLDTSLSPDFAGAERSLQTRLRLASLLLNFRHSFGDTLEAYIDVLLLENAGRAVIFSGTPLFQLSATAPANPFQQDILVSFPLPGYGDVSRYRDRTARLTGGIILNLAHGWKANADYSFARATTKTVSTGLGIGINAVSTSGPPLAGQAAFLASIAPLALVRATLTSRQTNFGDLTLRLAGPIAELGGGPLSLSLIAEDRRETYPPAPLFIKGISNLGARAEFSTRARSAYAELRALLIDRVTGIPGLRGLEFQLALRHDVNRTRRSWTTQDSTTHVTAYTAGLRFFPVEGVMLRGSRASGFLPPAVSQIGSSLGYLGQSSEKVADPLRGGIDIGSETVATVISGGSTNLLSERARSISAGVVFTPTALNGLRVSVDYTRIDKRQEIVSFHNSDPAYFIVSEGNFPGRVTRAPLTDADRAKGYTAGVVTVIDTTSFNVGKTVIEAVDVQVDYRIPTDTLGDFRLQAAGTWQPRLSRQHDPDSATVNSAGYAGGPLTWRANGGIEWQRGPLTLGTIATYYHGYRATRIDASATVNAQTILLQGGPRIPAQVYFDVFATRRIALSRASAGLTSLDIRFGIENLFDHRPPIIVDPTSANYSLYGDPRLRRFELSFVGHF